MKEVKLTRYYNNGGKVHLLFSNLEQSYGCSCVGECLMKKLTSSYISYARSRGEFEFRDSGNGVSMIYFDNDDIETNLWIRPNLIKEKIPILLKWMDKINTTAETDDTTHAKYLRTIFGEPGNRGSVDYPDTKYVKRIRTDLRDKLRCR